jgi:hypothetical protein
MFKEDKATDTFPCLNADRTETSFDFVLCEITTATILRIQIDALKPKLVYIKFKNPLRTAKRTPYFTIIRINCLMLFKEIIPVYSRN